MDNSKLYIDLVEYVRSRSVQMEEDVVLGINSATGALSKSVEVRDISSGPIVGFEIAALPYFKFVEEGRQKGKKMPPISSIQDWCEVVEIPVDILNSPDDINCSFDSGMVYEIPSATIESFSAGSF